MIETFDVEIVGGGFAGLSAALEICENSDLRVILFDKRRIGDPSKTSAATFPEMVNSYGLNNSVLQEYYTLSLRSELGSAASFTYDEPFMLLLDYEKACKLLLRRVKKRGCVVVEDYKVEGFKSLGNQIYIPDGDKQFSAKVLVDASGSEFFASRILGLPLPNLFIHCYGVALENCKIEDPEEWCLIMGGVSRGGAWVYPYQNNKIKFGTAIASENSAGPNAKLREFLSILQKNFQPYADMMKESKVIRVENGSIPVGAFENLVYKNVMFVGDAAALSTPWVLEGLRPGLISGKLCGEAIVEAFNGDFNQNKLIYYQKGWDKRFRNVYTKQTRVAYSKFLRDDKKWDLHVQKAKHQRASTILRVLKNGTLPPHLAIESYLRSLLRF
jgi:flavin-dependent dehydrogenase